MADENTNNPDEKRSLKDDFEDSAAADEFLDDSHVKFLNDKKDLENDPHVVVEVASDVSVSFTGLGKEELMQYANDPFWVKTRIILFVAFWVGWVGMLVAAIVIIMLAPRCPPRPDMNWYEKEVIYQINPKSFQDTTTDPADDGAGIGDLQGISNRVDYLEGLGVNAFWINSFYKSGGLYDGTDVEDHASVDAIFGSKASFAALRKKTKKKGMKMVVDFIPNHTGKKHEWFVKSQTKESEFADYYIWVGTNCSDISPPPNNWMTVYNKQAWTCDSTRKQFYYHSGLPEYPDLNLQNEAVRAQMDGVLHYWLTSGVDGFYLRDIHRLVEKNDTSLDETVAGEFTTDLPENILLVHRWSKIIRSYVDKPGREKLLMASVNPTGNNTHNYWAGGLDMIPTDALVDVDLSTCDFECLKTSITKISDGTVLPAWRVDSENSPRFGSTISKTYRAAFQALHLLLPGTALVYYGDEIAMTNGVIMGNEHKDPLENLGMGRDAYRTPMLWNNEKNAGFCANDITPWLPINPDYASNNFEYNNAHMVGYTVLESFKDLAALRQNPSFQWGPMKMYVQDNDDVLYFTRQAPGFPGYLITISRGQSAYAFDHIASEMKLVYHSEGKADVGATYNMKKAPIGFNKEGEVYVFEY